MKTTYATSPAPAWTLIDAEGQSLGRLSTEAAKRLRGKHKPNFAPHQLCGDHVIVINAAKMAIRPKSAQRKMYRKHTGYFGHLREQTLGALLEKKPAEVIERAVRGMLPRNRLRAEMLKRLHVFPDASHGFEAQQPLSITLPS